MYTLQALRFSFTGNVSEFSWLTRLAYYLVNLFFFSITLAFVPMTLQNVILSFNNVSTVEVMSGAEK